MKLLSRRMFDLRANATGDIGHFGIWDLSENFGIEEFAVAIVFETRDQMYVRMRNSDATRIGNDPFGAKHFPDGFRNSARFHKEEPDIGGIHIPYPAVMVLRDELRVPRRERIFIEEPEIFGILIDDMVRIRSAYDVAKGAREGFGWHSAQVNRNGGGFLPARKKKFFLIVIPCEAIIRERELLRSRGIFVRMPENYLTPFIPPLSE